MERKRQRREYLRQKGEAYASIAASGALILLSLGLLLLGFVAARRGHTEPVDGLVIGLLMLALAAGCGWGIYWGIRDVRATKESVDRIPYVPPITIEHLPPEEILVRGSGEPSHSPQEALLRPAGNRETPHEELLRLTIRTDEAKQINPDR